MCQPRDIHVIISDEHARQVLGSDGNPLVRARHLDRQAAEGALLVSFVGPHFPLIALPEFYHLYAPHSLPVPDRTPPKNQHPAFRAFRRLSVNDSDF